MEWLIAAALVPGLFKGIGAALASGDRQRAEDLRQKAMEEYDIKLPDLKEMEPVLQQRSELWNVQPDARYAGAENEALGMLGTEAKSGGLSPEDIATLERAKGQAAEYEAGVRGRNEAQMASRGIRGSGIDVANQLGAEQAGVNRAYRGGIEAAADANQRRLSAMGAYGSFSRALAESDLARRERSAGAQDYINAFNTQDKRYSRGYNLQLPQQQYENKLGLADRRYGALRQRGQDFAGYADKTEEMAGDLGEVGSDALSAVGNSKMKKK